MVSSASLRQPPTRPQYRRRTSLPSDQQRHSKYLDNKYWQQYRNNDRLAQQVYDLTHPDYLALAELELTLKWPTV